MLLALFITAIIFYLLKEKGPKYITRREIDEIINQTNKRESIELNQRISGLKVIENDGHPLFLLETERQELIGIVEREMERTRKEWLKALCLQHERGEISDAEFNEEVNRCLDDSSQ